MVVIKKIIEHGIDIYDPITLFTDVENNLLNMLRSSLVRRCFKGCFILSVDRLLRRSHCEINQDGNIGMGTMSVMFEVTALVYTPGDILVGCRVVNKQDDNIVCKGPNASVIINIGQNVIKPLLEGIRVGQYIPVRVGRVLYSPNAESISVNALPFTYLKPEVYKIVGGGQLDEAAVSMYSELIAAEEKRMEDLRKSSGDKWDFFCKIMSGKNTGYTPGRALSVMPKPDELVSRALDINPALSEYGVVSEAQKTIEMSSYDASIKLHHSYLQFIKMVNDSVETYTDKMVTEHDNIWKMLARLKNIS